MKQQTPNSKSKLAIMLSKLSGFEKPKAFSEQYATDSEAAADALWFAYMNGDVEGKVVVDFGCGTGILGIGALLLGAKKVYFVDSDKNALGTCKRNIAEVGISGSKIVNSDVSGFVKKVDTVIQNPPFGTKKKHADKDFLIKAFKTAGVVYSFHKIETKDFVMKLSADEGFLVTNVLEMELQLKKTFSFQKSKMKRLVVGFFRIEKK
jgi:putative methylase